MRAWAPKNNKPFERKVSKRKRTTRTTPPPPPSPPSSPPHANIHYEAGCTHSWQHRRCWHKHRSLIEAAKCAMPTGAGWYVFAVEDEEPRALRDDEDEILNRFRFGS